MSAEISLPMTGISIEDVMIINSNGPDFVELEDFISQLILEALSTLG